MNEFLAEMYGTRDNIGAPSNDAEVEKMAEAQLLDEALQAEDIDIDQLPGETIVKLAHQILGEDSQLVKAAMEEGSDQAEGEEPFEEKVAQADFLGRVMAHSYVNEMTNMEKEARFEGAKAGLGKAWEAVKSAPAVAKGRAKQYAATYKKSLGERARGAKHRLSFATMKGTQMKERAKLIGGAAKKLAPELGAGTAATAGGVAMAKSSSALNTLAEKRAMEWAAEHGLLGRPEEEKLASAVDQRAYEMLTAQGIDVDAIEAAAQE